MGAPMAQHLLRAGHEVALWSHQSQKVLDMAGEGKGFACSTPRQVAERADYIFYCVGDSSMAKAITSGREGLLEGVRSGSIIADCSTIAPAISREIGAA